MTWLAATPQRYSDESVQGYRCRVAAENGYLHWPSFVKAFLPQDKNLVAKYLRGGTYPVLGVELASPAPTDDIFRLHFARRVCPLCLRQAAYMREAWHLSLVTHCLLHCVELIDRCPDCGRALDNHWGMITHCRCGYDLRLIESKESSLVSDIEWFIAQDVEPVSVREGALPTLIQKLAPRGLERFTLLLGSYTEYRDAAKPRKIAIRSDLRIAMQVTNAANRIASNWPEGFYGLLDKDCDNNKSHIQSHFGHLYRAAYHEFSGSEFGFLRRAMDDYVALHWTGLITCKNKWQSAPLRNKPPYVSSTLLSKQTHINRQQYALWIEQGKLKGCIRKTTKGRQQVSIASEQHDLIYQLAKQRTLQQTAKQLALPEKRVRELVTAGLLTGYRRNAGAAWQINPASIQRFKNQIEAAALSVPLHKSSLTLDCILRHRMDDTLSFSELMCALIDRVVPFSIATGINTLNQIQVDKLGFDQWLAKKHTGISIPELAECLHIKQEVAYHLINKNIISTYRTGRSGCHVSNIAIEEFKRTYCFARDIALDWHYSSRKAITCLRQLGAEPIMGKDIDGCRQYLFRRSDVLQVSFPNNPND